MSKKTIKKTKQTEIDFSVFSKVKVNNPPIKGLGTMIVGTITLPAEQFAEYNRLGSEIAANKRAQSAIKEQWEKAGLLPVASKATNGQYVIVNGNGDEQGKATVYYFSGAVIPASYRFKIS